MPKQKIVDVRVEVGSHVIGAKGDVYHVGLDKVARSRDGGPASFLTYLGNVIDDLKEILKPPKRRR